MGENRDRIDHFLGLKVMRLTRPTFATPLVITTDKRDLVRDVLNKDLRDDVSSVEGLEEMNLGPILVLPQSFGSIYLGETFSSYVCLNNDSTDTCQKVQMRCDLQTATQRIPLYPPPSQTGSQSTEAYIQDELQPGSSIDHVLHHEVKELGTHILVCEVTYTSPSGEKLNFRKFFKFQVMKPLDVKTKFYNAESDEVFLEAQVQNVTTGPLCLERVTLDPSALFRCTPLNTIDSADEPKSVFGSVNCLQSQDSRQYLFCLTPKPDVRGNYKLLKGVTNIGKLDIVWRTNLGDRGRLQTSQLQRMAPTHGDVRLTIDHAPSLVAVDKAFTIGSKIINNSERTLDLEMNLNDISGPRMTWSGGIFKKLGLLEPGGCIPVSVEAVPHDTGLQLLSGIRITDTLLKRTYDFDELCQVYVTKDEEMLRAICAH